MSESGIHSSLTDEGSSFLVVLKRHEPGAWAPLAFKGGTGGSLELTGDKGRDNASQGRDRLGPRAALCGSACLKEDRPHTTVVHTGERTWRSFQKCS